MVVVHSYGLAIFMTFITMLCWGSWANTQKLASKHWSFQLFYWDYSIGIVLLTLFLAFTMGSFGAEGRSFMADLCQASAANLGLAIASGVIFNLANILLVVAIDIAGMAVAFPIAIGLALVIGVIVNYLGHPIGNAVLLFIGVGLVALAIIVDAMAYRMTDSHRTKTTLKGIIIALISGILMGFFYRFLAQAMSVNYVHTAAEKLTPYTAAFIFSVGLFASNFVYNTIFMHKPVSGNPVRYKDYFTKGNLKTHLVGILGGIIWSIGLTFNLVAAGPAGYAISYGLGQGATMVAAFWGVYIWKEFAAAPHGVRKWIRFMFLLYIVGLILIIVSRVA